MPTNTRADMAGTLPLCCVVKYRCLCSVWSHSPALAFADAHLPGLGNVLCIACMNLSVCSPLFHSCSVPQGPCKAPPRCTTTSHCLTLTCHTRAGAACAVVGSEARVDGGRADGRGARAAARRRVLPGGGPRRRVCLCACRACALLQQRWVLLVGRFPLLSCYECVQPICS